MARTHFACHRHGTGNIDRCRTAKIQAFIAHQIEDDGKGVYIGKAVGGVDRGLGKIGGNPSLANAFGDGIAFCF